MRPATATLWAPSAVRSAASAAGSPAATVSIVTQSPLTGRKASVVTNQPPVPGPAAVLAGGPADRAARSREILLGGLDSSAVTAAGLLRRSATAVTTAGMTARFMGSPRPLGQDVPCKRSFGSV